MPSHLLRNGSLVLFLSLFFFICNSQDRKVDSLQKALKRLEGVKRNDIRRYDIIKELIITHASKGDNEIALSYTYDALQVAYLLGDSAKISKMLQFTGQLLNLFSRSVEAEKKLLLAKGIARRNDFRHDYEVILNNLGLAYSYQAKYDEALMTHFEALSICEEDRDDYEIAISLNNIGLLYYMLKDFETAKKYYTRSLEVKSRNNDKYDLDKLLVNIGLCFVEIGAFKNADIFFDSAFSVCGRMCRDDIVVEGEFGYGYSHFLSEKDTEAQKHFEKSLAVARLNYNYRFIAENLSCLAQIHLKKREYEASLKQLHECYEVCTRFNFNEIRVMACQVFWKTYEQLNDDANVIRYQREYIRLKDSLYNEQLVQNLMVVQAEFAQGQNNLKLASQKKIMALRDDSIAKQKVLGVFAIIAVLLFTFIAALLFRTNKRNFEFNRSLENKVMEQTSGMERRLILLKQMRAKRQFEIDLATSNVKALTSTIQGLASLSETERPTSTIINEQVDAIKDCIASIIKGIHPNTV